MPKKSDFSFREFLTPDKDSTDLTAIACWVEDEYDEDQDGVYPFTVQAGFRLQDGADSACFSTFSYYDHEDLVRLLKNLRVINEGLQKLESELNDRLPEWRKRNWNVR